MPVRLRITFLFAILAMLTLGMVCAVVYFFSYTSRLNAIKMRLTNRATTTARLLAQREIFDQRLVKRIDSLTTISLINKTVQAYNISNEKIYSFSDQAGDTIRIERSLLDKARANGRQFFKSGEKEAIAYYSAEDFGMVVISAAEDVEGKKSLARLLNILMFGFLIGTSLVLVFGYFFSTRLLRPIKKIAGDAEEISAQNLARRIKTGKTKDEWYQLAVTLNRLFDRLQESFELQRRFIANASHELSTPLTAILSQLEVALQRDREAEEYKKVINSVSQDVRDMSKLTKTLLEFAKASGNPGGLEINLVRIDEIILRLPGEIARIEGSYSVSITFGNLPEEEESLLVFGNEGLLMTAIKNIVVNACKYSDDHHAEVGLSVEERNITIEVSDKGPGIDEDKLKTIFQPFYRIEENSASQGFGLGLSLAERIIKLHKGNILVSSRRGEGSIFSIQFPSAKSLS